MLWNARLSVSRLPQLYSALRKLCERGQILRTSPLFHSQLEGFPRFVLDFHFSDRVKTETLFEDVTLSAPIASLPASMKPVLASPQRCLELGRKTLVFGILNVTPDSFSDGGRFLAPGKAYEQAVRLVEEGADAIDIGAESTRPGSDSVSLQTELERLLPVIQRLRSDSRLKHVWLSVDTVKPEVAEAALAAGADMINDVGFGRAASAAREAPYILMHSRGAPKDMQTLTEYPEGVVAGVVKELKGKVDSLRLWDFNLVLDPGIGFAKTPEQCWTLVRHFADLREALPYPWLIGHSNKRFLRSFDLPSANIAVAGAAINSRMQFLRVHNVRPIVLYARAAEECRLQPTNA